MALSGLSSIRTAGVALCVLCIVILVTEYSGLNNNTVYMSVETSQDKASDVQGIQRAHDEADFSTTKTILAYSKSRWLNEWVGRRWDTTEVFKSCPLSTNCILTLNKSLVDDADAVMINWLTLCRHWKKQRSQVWIMFEFESPDYNARYEKKRCWRNKVVNWTLTYRRDSDFSLVHGLFHPQDTGYNVDEKLLRSKSKTAVGFISHCNASSKREKFIRALRSHGVDIDIFGRCGNLRCGGEFNTKWKGVWNVTSDHQDHCFDVLDNRYKFYLSFENSLCKDYVTEKSLHLVLRHQIVPLIRDGANRTLYHPPHSFLDTKNFKSVKELANRIKFLSNNFDSYLKFFQWKKKYTIGTVSGVLQSIFCDMCHRLHHQHKYTRLYRNLKNFYTNSHDTHDDEGICKTPHDII
ncbi:glycoprotein 3-alpha-L-fucosyltransferase A-like [Ylistrum balloti]|uniref:glycoprotein 3-alpha-L-fucosyltransferase A-like n=1 Tax=Ylistrum balloti TaxID=509963 RepID=UPI002905C2D4|nr:glycoprotein 3-alpha-L-fucosyltransferase A-like [Ylistrum balloti]